MSVIVADRVVETSNTMGTGAYTLAGAVTGYQSFAVVGDGNVCEYTAFSVGGNGVPDGGWEVGRGVYTAAGTTLSRTTIRASSNGGAAVSWAAGTRRVCLMLPAVQTIPMHGVHLFSMLNGLTFPVPSTTGNFPSGDTTIYTCPTGRRAIVCTRMNYNASVGSITHSRWIKIGSTKFRASNNLTLANGTGLGANFFTMLEAGDQYVVTTTAAGLNAWHAIFEFDATSHITQGRVMGMATGANVIYTCPAGKQAIPISLNSLVHGVYAQGNIVADAGGTRGAVRYVVPSGGSPSAANQISSSGAVTLTADTIFTHSCGTAFAAGDFFHVTWDVGAATSWTSLWVHEIDA